MFYVVVDTESWPSIAMLIYSFFRSRSFRLIGGLCGIALIAFADRELHDGIPLALLYLLPICVMSTVLRRWQIPTLGVICTLVAELSDAFPWTVSEGIARDVLYFCAYTGAGLYVSEVLSRRRQEEAHIHAMQAEMETRRGVEEQLRLLFANSSIAIISADEFGAVLQANEAAETLYSGEKEHGTQALKGATLRVFLPSLAQVPIRKQGWEHLRTMMQCQGFRASGEPFLADVWFSTYMTSSGGRLTAMIVDSSFEMRDRENANLEQVMVGSRLAVGALSHEIRNICAAISVVQQNLLLSVPGDKQLMEFDALRQLVDALERMASVELSLVKRQAARLKLESFLRDLYIIIQASLSEAGIALDWQIDPGLPDVWADQPSLLQVFLNLMRNAEKAFGSMSGARLCVKASSTGGLVQITVSDNGPGVSHPDELFRPFAAHHGASGLGLYLSRAMMRSFYGDLRHQPGLAGATFQIELVAAEVEE